MPAALTTATACDSAPSPCARIRVQTFLHPGTHQLRLLGQQPPQIRRGQPAAFLGQQPVQRQQPKAAPTDRSTEEVHPRPRLGHPRNLVRVLLHRHLQPGQLPQPVRPLGQPQKQLLHGGRDVVELAARLIGTTAGAVQHTGSAAVERSNCGPPPSRPAPSPAGSVRATRCPICRVRNPTRSACSARSSSTAPTRTSRSPAPTPPCCRQAAATVPAASVTALVALRSPGKSSPAMLRTPSSAPRKHDCATS
ncbi:hypothetical protein M2271_008059 [Streptomyces sp. LBL]|nr:hypothetical protein [Streptomyces sp. LBL]